MQISKYVFLITKKTILWSTDLIFLFAENAIFLDFMIVIPILGIILVLVVRLSLSKTVLEKLSWEKT